jgi:acyl CoA:acetate/3-ketoacid CoA transferase alpha subunit
VPEELGFRHSSLLRERVSFTQSKVFIQYIASTVLTLLYFADTLLQAGEIPVRLDESGKVLERGTPRETRIFNGKTYLMETALTGDVAILRAWKADEAGNCVFR